MRDGQDINVYINFSLYAILGKLAEADGLLKEHGAAVHRVADYLAARHPVPRVPLYRGMLVDPDAQVRRDDRYAFVSWSEDRDVAVWFASRESVISEYIVEHKPRVRGVVVELPAPRRILFHYSWAEGWDELALLHPHMGYEGARQIAWSLRTQREVITGPVDLPPHVDVDALEHPPITELDGRLAPPWITAANHNDTPAG